MAKDIFVIPRKVKYADRPAIEMPMDDESAHLLSKVIDCDKAVMEAANERRRCYDLTVDLFSATDDFLAATSKNRPGYVR